MARLTLLQKTMLQDLCGGGFEDTLQDMTESPYPYTKKQLKDWLMVNGINVGEVYMEDYDTIEPGTPGWYTEVEKDQSYKPKAEILALAKKFGNIK